MARAMAEGGKVSFHAGERRSLRPVRRRRSQGRCVGAELWVTGERTSGATGASVSGSPPRIGLGNDGLDRVAVRHARREVHEGHHADLQAGNLASSSTCSSCPPASAAAWTWRRWWRRWRRRRRGGAVLVQRPGPSDASRAVDEFVRERRHRHRLGQRRLRSRVGAPVAGAEHGRRSHSAGVLHGHVDHAGVDRHASSRDVRHAGARRRHRQPAAGVHDD